MNLDFSFFITSAMLGVGLAMDAFSVSLANGLSDNKMKLSKMCGISLVFALFQALMPLIGWLCVHTVAKYFAFFEKLIPWIALCLLSFIGGKMIYEGVKSKEEKCCVSLTLAAILIQGIATSIDALSVGFTISDYDFFKALLCAGIIATLTFAICLAGIFIGKRAGTHLSGKACILGGAILVFIGLEIFITGII